MLYENFNKIGPIIKKIPKFQSDPLNTVFFFILPVRDRVSFNTALISMCAATPQFSVGYLSLLSELCGG